MRRSAMILAVLLLAACGEKDKDDEKPSVSRADREAAAERCAESGTGLTPAQCTCLVKGLVDALDEEDRETWIKAAKLPKDRAQETYDTMESGLKGRIGNATGKAREACMDANAAVDPFAPVPAPETSPPYMPPVYPSYTPTYVPTPIQPVIPPPLN